MGTDRRGAGGLDVPALDAVGGRLEAAEVARSAAYAEVLGDALLMERLLADAGMGLSAGADLALRLRCSEWRADRLLEQARVLSGLPDGLAVLAEGLLTVEQVGVFVSETARLTGAPLLRVWERLVARLRAGVESGEVLPPGRLISLLRRWVLAAAPLDAVAERERAEADRKVEVRRREDGLADLFALGMSGPNAHACLSRIRAASAPVGPDDARSADQRRLDALVDLITGQIALPLPGLDLDGPALDGPVLDGPVLDGPVLDGPVLDGPVLDGPVLDGPVLDGPALDGPALDGAGCHGSALESVGAGQGSCGCPSAAPVPCGADMQVLVPIGAALETTDEVAELVGVGPLDPDLLRRLLLAAPRLRAVFVDEHGVPLGTGSRTWTPDRADPAGLRAQLLALAAEAPPPPEPRHPGDHPPIEDALPAECRGPDADPPQGSRGDPPGSGAHPPDRAGPYRVGERLRRLLTVRRPLCEWPGCGMPASRCDMEHDVAWPAGPTCGCDVGPCCRHHHRIKQTGWTKSRTATGVSWTGPTGQCWWSPSPYEPPAATVRPLPELPVDDPLALLSRLEWECELDPADVLLDDAGSSPLRDDTGLDDLEPDDPLGRRLRWRDTTWTLDLDEAQAWQDIPHTADR